MTFSEFRLEEEYEVSMNDDYALFVTRVLKEMPILRSFQYVLLQVAKSYANIAGKGGMITHLKTRMARL